jgi:hypothetical protein
MARGYDMSAEELRDHMEELEILAAQLASMLGIKEHGARRYTLNGDGNRGVPPSLALLMRLMKRHPELKAEVFEIAAGGELPEGCFPPSRSEEGIALAERRSARQEKAAADAKLLSFHQGVIDALRDQQRAAEIRSQALAKIDLWEREGACSEDFVARWRLLLEMPLDDMADEVLRADRWGPALRQATPFGFMYKDRAP